MSWQWWVSQSLSLVALVFLCFSFQQKETKKLVWYRLITDAFFLAGMIFLNSLSAILLLSVAMLRNFVSLFYAYKPQVKQIYKIISSVVLIALLITLNIVFWSNYLNIMSICLGMLYIIMFIQKQASTIRWLSLIAGVIAIVYFCLIISPISVVIEVVGMISVVIGIIRLDIKKKINNESNVSKSKKALKQ